MKVAFRSASSKYPIKIYWIYLTSGERSVLEDHGLTGGLKIKYRTGTLCVTPDASGSTYKDTPAGWLLRQVAADAAGNPARSPSFGNSLVPSDNWRVDDGMLVIDLNFNKLQVGAPRGIAARKTVEVTESKSEVTVTTTENVEATAMQMTPQKIRSLEELGMVFRDDEKAAADAALVVTAATNGEPLPPPASTDPDSTEWISWLIEQINQVKASRGDALQLELDDDGYLDAVVRMRLGNRR